MQRGKVIDLVTLKAPDGLPMAKLKVESDAAGDVGWARPQRRTLAVRLDRGVAGRIALFTTQGKP